MAAPDDDKTEGVNPLETKMGFKVLCGLLCVILLSSLPAALASTKQVKSQTSPVSVNLQSVQDPRGTDKTPLIVHENDSPRTPEEAATKNAKEQKENSYRTNEEIIAIFAGFCALLQAVILLMQWAMLRRQTNHMITSERAWFICRVFMIWGRDKTYHNMVVGTIGFKYKNVGQTPGFIREIGFAVTPLPRGEQLPSGPFNYKVADRTEWSEGRGLPIAPKNNMGRRAQFTPTQSELDALKEGTLIIWVHGYVRYHESFTNTIRETRYCVQCKPSDPYGDEKSYFVFDGPPEYNSAT
jgi:hypothetical protein